MELTQSILSVTFQNPTVLASGIWGFAAENCRKYIAGGAGGITVKSFGVKERTGHPEPIIIRHDEYTLNAVGLPSKTPDAVKAEFGPLFAKRPVPLIFSLMGDSVDMFGEAASAYAELKPDFFECNISCPNVEDDFGRPFAFSPDDAAAVTKAVKAAAGSIPVFIKLSPNAERLKDVALACAGAGADGFTLINTVGPGMEIDLETREPVLSNRVGGLSGHAAKPIAVRCIADVYAVTEGKLPIIGTGGVSKGTDAIELMMAGASLIGIGTAIWERGDDVFRRVTEELQAWGDKEGVKEVGELVGAMHRL